MDLRTRLTRLLALVNREILEGSRGRTLFVGRTVLAAIPLLFVFWYLERQFLYPHLAPETLSQLAAGIFLGVTLLISASAVLLGSGLAIRSLRAEVRQETLGLLLLSRLSPRSILVAKLVTVVASLAMMTLALLPILAVAGLYGGLEYRWLGALAFLTVVLGAFGAATGLLTSVLFRSALAAGFASFSIWAAVTYLLPYVEPNLYGSAGSAFEETFSPYRSIWYVATQGSEGGSLLAGSLTLSLLTVLFLTIAARRLPRLGPRQPSAGLRGLFEQLDAFFEKINWRGIRFEGRRSAPWDIGPVYWLARTTGGIGLARYTLRVSAGLFLAAFLLVSYQIMAGDSLQPLLWGFQVFQLLLGGILGSLSIAPERANKTLPALLTTCLSGRDILNGKTRAGLRAMTLVSLPFVLFVLLLAQVGRLARAYSLHIWLGESFEAYLLLASGLALGFAAYLVSQFFSLVSASALKAWGLSSAFLTVLYVLVVVLTDGEAPIFLSVHLILWSALGAAAFALSLGSFSRLTGRSGDG